MMPGNLQAKQPGKVLIPAEAQKLLADKRGGGPLFSEGLFNVPGFLQACIKISYFCREGKIR